MMINEGSAVQKSTDKDKVTFSQEKKETQAEKMMRRDGV